MNANQRRKQRRAALRLDGKDVLLRGRRGSWTRCKVTAVSVDMTYVPELHVTRTYDFGRQREKAHVPVTMVRLA